MAQAWRLAGGAGAQRRRAGDGVWRRVARPSVVDAWQARGAAREGGLGENMGREGGLARGAARGRPVAAPAANAVTASKQRVRRDGGEGKIVINSKFQNPFYKLKFSPLSWPQTKNYLI